MPAPYSADPPSAQAQTQADGIFYGWLGLMQDAAFTTALKGVLADAIEDGVTAALQTNWDNNKAEWASLLQTAIDDALSTFGSTIDLEAALTTAINTSIQNAADLGNITTARDAYVGGIARTIAATAFVKNINKDGLDRAAFVTLIDDIAEQLFAERQLP